MRRTPVSADRPRGFSPGLLVAPAAPLGGQARRWWRRRSSLSPVAALWTPTPGVIVPCLPPVWVLARHLGAAPSSCVSAAPCRARRRAVDARVLWQLRPPRGRGSGRSASDPAPLLCPRRPARVPFSGRACDQGLMSPRATHSVRVSRQEQAVEREQEREEFQREIRSLEEQLRRAPQPRAPGHGDVSRPRRPLAGSAFQLQAWARGRRRALPGGEARGPPPWATCQLSPVGGSCRQFACSF